MSTTMRYFRNTAGETFGYDPAEEAQETLIADALAAGWTDVTGSWPPPAPAPTLAQQAQALLAGGLAVTCTSDAALTATYPTDPVSQTKMLGLQMTLTVTGTFPGGATTWPIKDATGTARSMTGTQFAELAVKVVAFVAQCDLVIDGLSATLPPATATIA